MANVQLKTPFTLLVCAPTKSGKSTFVSNILREAGNPSQLYDRPPGPIYYFYNLWSPTFDQMKDEGVVERFIQGNCSMAWLKDNITPGENSTVVVDDQAADVAKDTAQLFAVGSHQMDCNFIFLAQTTFSKNRYFRDVSLNSSYLILMKNPRDKSSISYLARQLDPDKPNFIVWAYNEATKEPFSHLLFDFNQSTPDYLRFRSNILAENGKPISIYLKE